MSRFCQQVNKYLTALQQGDQTKFQPLYDLTVNYLRKIAYDNLTIKSYCGDVISEVYVRVIKHIDSFDPNKDGYNWLYTITVNVARNFNKAERKYVATDADFAENRNGQDEYEDVNTRVDIFASLQVLDKIDYQIAVKRYYYFMTQEQIGKDLGMTKSAVNQRLSKIRKKLSQIYKKP